MLIRCCSESETVEIEIERERLTLNLEPEAAAVDTIAAPLACCATLGFAC